MQSDNRFQQLEPRLAPNPSGKKMDKSNGHEIILKSYIINRSPIRLNLDDGKFQNGRITQFDKFTITIMKHSPQGLEVGLETYFKHSIKSFSPVMK